MSPNKKSINWNLIESDWIQLPKLFKVFHNTYDIKTIRNLEWYTYENEYGLDTLGDYTHPLVQNIILDKIFDLEKIKETIPKVLDLEETVPDFTVYKKKIIPIAYGPGGELLMLGVGENNADKIYYFVRHLDEFLKEIAENIFDFFKSYHIVVDQDNAKLSRLYRNWDDKFWRLKP